MKRDDDALMSSKGERAGGAEVRRFAHGEPRAMDILGVKGEWIGDPGLEILKNGPVRQMTASVAATGRVEKNVGGRPRGLDQVKKEIARRLSRVGMSRRRTAEILGVSGTTLRREMDRDEGFCSAIEDAEAEALAGHVGMIELAAQKSWRAAAWLLERMLPEEFGKGRPTKREDTRREVGASIEALERVSENEQMLEEWLEEEDEEEGS